MNSLWIPLLLAAPSASLRWLVLRDLLERPDDDPELLERLRIEVGRLYQKRAKSQT